MVVISRFERIDMFLGDKGIVWCKILGSNPWNLYLTLHDMCGALSHNIGHAYEIFVM